MPPLEPAAAVFLDFSRDVLTKTTLSLRGTSSPIYQVSSEDGLSTTHIHRISSSESELLATIARTDLILPDKITMRGRKTVKVRSWLKPQGILSTIPATMEEDGTVYTWKTNDVGLLSLWSGKEQIAWYQPAARRMVDGKSVLMPAYLALDDVALPIQDSVVISCLVLGQKLRWDAKGNGYTAAAVTGSMLGSFFQ
ncbi:hypothetical protein B0H19DRAFT_1267165 [Mycena capillaripes]|nr:hypothetical protein B0H19DRAFT_1267165 [Mycena capillaripes]